MPHDDDRLLESFGQAIQLEPARQSEVIQGLVAGARAEEARELERLLALDRAEGPLAREPLPAGSRAGPAPQANGNGSGERQDDGAPGTAADDKYELLGEIGQGAFGQIYRARHRSLKREVALKVHRNVPAACRERLLSEAQALARVSHPNVVTIHDVHGEGDVLRLELELIQGENFHQIVERGGPLAPREAALVALDLCRALAAIHAVDLVHMDVKPANVMRASGGRIVLLDFGLTRRCAGDEQQVPVGGTPAFMAPECCRPDPEIGPAADVYALGVTLYWLVTGRYPYPTRMLQRLRWQLSSREPRPLIDLRPDLPREFVDVVARAMQKAPVQRFASMGEMEAALGRYLSVPAPARRPRALALAAGVLAFTAAGVGWWASTRAPAFVLEHEFRLERGNEVSVLGEDATVQTGDWLSLGVRIAEPVFVYLFQEDDEGRRKALFPTLDGLQNPLPAGDLVLPTGGAVWTLKAAGGGGDHLYLLASTQPLQAAEVLWQQLEKPRFEDDQEASQSMDETMRGLRMDLRGDWELKGHPSVEPVGSLAAIFDGFEQGPLRSGVFFRRLHLRNP